ncbi:hypothetical protein ACJRPK_11715 [Aquimarina sp. 2-A2]|uniref:hypothetical protein n=1 Tax=Aquimarina sp. 2-A2 TaxID=3382644 RepID=UPI00387F3052
MLIRNVCTYYLVDATQEFPGYLKQIYVSAALKEKHVAIDHIGNEIWKVIFSNVFLGFFDERHLRNKQQLTRLETNLV